MQTRLPLAAWSKRMRQAFFKRRTVLVCASCQACSSPDSPLRLPSSLPAAGDVQLHGSLAAEEAVVEQEVSSDACVDAIQGISLSIGLLPIASAARIRTEDSQGMFSIVDLYANQTLLGLRRETAHAMAFVAPVAMQSVFHGWISILQSLTVFLETDESQRSHLAALRADAMHVAEFGIHHRIDAVLVKHPGGLADFAERLIMPHLPGLDQQCHTVFMQLPAERIAVQAAIGDKVKAKLACLHIRQEFDHYIPHTPVSEEFAFSTAKIKRQLVARVSHQMKLVAEPRHRLALVVAMGIFPAIIVATPIRLWIAARAVGTGTTSGKRMQSTDSNNL